MKNVFKSLLVKVTIVLCLIYCSPANLTSEGLQDIIINDVTTSIDISTQLVNVEYKLSVVSKANEVKSFIFTIDPLLINSVSYISAHGKIVDVNNPLLSQGNGVWKVNFEQSMTKGQIGDITVFVIYTHLLKSFPTKIKQDEKHLVIFSGPVSLYSSYLSLNHSSRVTLGKGKVEKITKPLDFELEQSSQLLTFTSKNPIKPYVNAHCLIHYEHKITFLTVKKLHRTIEISHWGSIKIVEEILLENSGAKLYGPYHRQFHDDKGSNNIKFFTTILPAAASDISIYDEIGVVSTFKTKIKEDCIELELHPRFLLYGGWKIKYFLTYNVPSYEYLFNDGNDYKLKMRAVDHIYDNMVIENAVVNIILPEGTKQFNLETPYSVHHLNQSFHYSYLDTVGRPVITFSKENLVEQHIQDFVLDYEFNKLKMFFEPLYIIVFIQSIFILIIIFGRLDFAITKENTKETKDKCGKVLGSNKTKKKKN